jgi:hypothetical protein
MKTNNSEITYLKDTFQEYLGKKDHVSASDIKSFMKSPKYYYYSKYEEIKKSDEDLRHLTIGSALHESILEPHQFFENYIVSPKFDRRTKEGKTNFESWSNANKGKKILFEDEMDMIIRMGENALKNKNLIELVNDSYRELSIYTIDEKTGLKIKLRPDVFCKSKSTIVDIKTCLDSSAKGFKSNVYTYGYSTTDAFYKDFSNKENYVFCAVEKTAPNQVSLYQLPDEMVDYGRNQYRTALDLMKWSYDNNFWCDYNEFEILKECYELENMDNFFDLIEQAITIQILK